MDKIQLLKKLNTLMQDTRGNSNERENAEKILAELIKKYNISLDDINNDEQKDRYIEFNNDYEKQLICQICYKLFKHEKSVRSFISKKSKFNRTHVIIQMTDEELIEFEYLYSIYKTDLAKEMNLFYTAFINKNNIFPELTDNELNLIKSTPSEYNNDERIRMTLMADGIKRSQIRKSIKG